MRLLSGVALVAGSAAMTVTGCAAAHSLTLASSGTPTASASSVATRSHVSPRQRAVVDAAAIMASFVPPPGARRLARAPDLTGGGLRSPWSAPRSATLVDDVSWWRAPGQPAAVLAWEKARLPRGFTLTGSGYGGSGAVTAIWGDTFSLPAVPGVLNTRNLVIEMTGDGRGDTAIRVDAQVTWQQARSAAHGHHHLRAGRRQVI